MLRMLDGASRADNNGHADDHDEKGREEEPGLFTTEPLADHRRRA